MTVQTMLRWINRQGNRTALVLVTSTVVLIVAMAYTLVGPPLRAYQDGEQDRQRFPQAVEQALPVGAIRTASGVGGGSGVSGSFTGVASGHLPATPAAVTANPGVRPGTYGWTLIPDCGAGLVCFASSGKDYLLTLTVHPCLERGCPAGGSQVDAQVSRGGPNS